MQIIRWYTDLVFVFKYRGKDKRHFKVQLVATLAAGAHGVAGRCEVAAV